MTTEDARVSIARKYLGEYERALADFKTPMAWYHHAGQLSGSIRLLLDLITETPPAAAAPDDPDTLPACTDCDHLGRPCADHMASKSHADLEDRDPGTRAGRGRDHPC